MLGPHDLANLAKSECVLVFSRRHRKFADELARPVTLGDLWTFAVGTGTRYRTPGRQRHLP